MSSCTPIAFIIYGVKKPRPVSEKKIHKAIDKYELTHFNHYTFESQSDFVHFFQKTNNIGIGTSINQVLIFNKQGFLYLPKDTTRCSSNIIDFINHYEDRSVISDTVQFSTIFKNSFRQLGRNKEKFFFPTMDNGDLLVFTWASFVGRLNSENTKYWADSILNKVQKKEIDAIFLNLDIQRSWK